MRIPDSTLLHGLRHDGRFTASAPFCSEGRAYDVRHFEGDPLSLLRIHTCDDGSGSFTAFMPTVRNEHGGLGTWRIVEGTGRYATLRGMGIYGGTLVSGNPLFYETISYRTNWQGLVDFLADPPAIGTFTTTARASFANGGSTYVRRIGLAIQIRVRPSCTLVGRSRRDGVPADVKQGSTALGKQRSRFGSARRARPAARPISITARDALGNEASASRTVGLQ